MKELNKFNSRLVWLAMGLDQWQILQKFYHI